MMSSPSLKNEEELGEFLCTGLKMNMSSWFSFQAVLLSLIFSSFSQMRRSVLGTHKTLMSEKSTPSPTSKWTEEKLRKSETVF